MFAMASLCVTENIHIFNRRKIQIVLRRSARKDRLRNEGAVRNAEDVGRFFRDARRVRRRDRAGAVCFHVVAVGILDYVFVPERDTGRRYLYSAWQVRRLIE